MSGSVDIDNAGIQGRGTGNHRYGKVAGKSDYNRNSGGKPCIPGEKRKDLSSEKNRTQDKEKI